MHSIAVTLFWALFASSTAVPTNILCRNLEATLPDMLGELRRKLIEIRDETKDKYPCVSKIVAEDAILHVYAGASCFELKEFSMFYLKTVLPSIRESHPGFPKNQLTLLEYMLFSLHQRLSKCEPLYPCESEGSPTVYEYDDHESSTAYL